jgi:hypothetical protein
MLKIVHTQLQNHDTATDSSHIAGPAKVTPKTVYWLVHTADIRTASWVKIIVA